MNIISIIKKFIALFFGALLLYFCFLFRFFKEHLPHAINDIKSTNYIYILFFLMIFLLISIYIQISLFSNKKTETYRKNNNFMLNKISLLLYRLYQLIEFLINNFYDFCCYLFSITIKYHYLVIIKFGKFFIKLNKNSKLCIILILSFEFFPRILFNFALFLDIFVFEYFYYSYRCIFVLLLPLLLRIYLYMIRRLFSDYFKLTRDMLIITFTGEDNQEFSYTPEYDKNPPWFVKDLDDFIDNHFTVLVLIRSTMDYFNDIQIKRLYYNQFVLFLTIFRLLTIMYILYSIINI